MSPLPSIYGDEEPIADPGIRAEYLGDIYRKSVHVLNHGGMERLAFGDGDAGGYSVFNLFDYPTGGDVAGGE